MVTAVSAPWSLFSKINERVTLSLLPFPKLPAAFSVKVAEELISPSFPSANLEHLGSNFTGHANIALLRPKNWPTAGGEPPPELHGFENFFVPLCETLQKDHHILLLGHGGRVHAANDSVVEHTASVIPGISGGAGTDNKRPWRLYFTHIQTVDDVKSPWSFGTSTKYPYFALSYCTKGIPWFTHHASQVKFSEDQKLCLQEYIAYFDKHLDAWNVQENVTAFKRAFAW